MNILVLNVYEKNEMIDIEFNVDCCVEWVRKNVSMDWVEEDSVEDLCEGGGDDEEDFGNGVMMGGKLNEELGFIQIDYMMFCCEKGWTEVECYFVKKS